MSPDHLVMLSAAVACAAFVQGSTGVGFALILSPLLACWSRRCCRSACWR